MRRTNLLAALSRVVGVVRQVWFVALAGILLTLSMAQQARSAPGVYWGAVDVVFLAPPSALAPNSLGLVSGSLISTAGLVQRQVMEGPGPARVVSDSVTLLDEGITAGRRVTLPNAGGQWANNFERAVLRVQASDPREAVARQRLSDTVDEITSVLRTRQDEAGVLPAHRISTRLTPTTLVVTRYAGDPRRQTLSSLVLGLGVTASAVGLAHRWKMSPRRVRT